MNPDSLDSSIQSALATLFPPFEATAPVVLSQLFRTIEERYHGDALQCMLDFLIPSKHLMESVQQAACAGYSDVVFRYEGWPLCLHDKTVIQLAPVNPLLLRPGDFYLQVEPFGDQAVRIVLKSLLEEGCREVEETPIPETFYPCIFTETWLQDVNEGRHGTPLSRCLLCTDQGVIKLPWAEIAIPEFLDKPKFVPMYQEVSPQPKQISVPSNFNSCTLPLETAILSVNDRMSASLRPVNCSSKVDHEKRIPKSFSKPLIKPVGWVSPNTWDSRNYTEIEGDYVDLVDIATEKENPPNEVLFKPVRPPPPVPHRKNVFSESTVQYLEHPYTPCSQRKLEEPDPTEQDLKCRYRDSYLAALRNPVPFEKGSVDLLAALEEVGLGEELELTSKSPSEAQRDELGNFWSRCTEPVTTHQLCQSRQRCDPTTEIFAAQLKDLPTSSGLEDIMKEAPVIFKSTPGLSYSHKVQTKLISHQLRHNPSENPVSDACLESCPDGDTKPQQTLEGVKPLGKHKGKHRSLSTVSETPKGSPPLCKVTNRSHSDICPETISSIMKCKKDELLGEITPRLEIRKSPRKESQFSRSEASFTTDGPDSRLQHSKTDEPSSHLCPVGPASPQCPQTQESSLKRVFGLLELGIMCLPGSRDKTSRAVVEVHCDRKEWTSLLISAQSLCDLLLYLHSVPRKDVRELGMTVVINARKKPPPPPLYKALLMAQEQALHAVHSILMLVEKDTGRPEKQPGLQMDMVTSVKSLYKTVEASQLTSDLCGTFTYSHSDWLQFHQRLVSFMTDLQGADSLLQRAIKKVDGSKVLDTAQQVQLCIQEQRASMKEVLEDTRLVTLQREGGSVVARMRRKEFRFPHSEDYRDALESVSCLYNQVEEKLHTLVMRSNESLQQLEFLLRLREMEAKLSEAGTWFTEDGEQRLKDSYVTDDSLVCAERRLQEFDVFLTQFKEKQQRALTLVMDAENIAATSVHSPETDVFHTLISTFKSNVDDFMLRAEQRHNELDTLVHVYRFCDQASSLAKECSHFFEQVEQGCYSAQAALSTLQMYERKMGGEFSASLFHDVKSKACAVRSGVSGVMRVWNAAWVQCQEVRQRLEEMQKKKEACVDKRQNKKDTAVNNQGEAGGLEKPEIGADVGEAERPLTAQQTTCQEVDDITHGTRESVYAAGLHHKEKEALQSATAPVQNKVIPLFEVNDDRHPQSKWRLREHQSEADLRSDSAERDNDFPWHRPFGRSLSEGSCVSSLSTFTLGISPLNAQQKHCQINTQPLELNVQLVQDLPTSHQEILHPRHFSYKSPRDSSEEKCPTKGCTVSTNQDVRTPETSVIPSENNGSNVVKLQRIMEELLSTEREYVKALGYVREHYFPELERSDVPQDLRGQRGNIFGNLEKLHDFHHHHFLNELESCVNEPFRVARCFLRHSFSIIDRKDELLHECWLNNFVFEGICLLNTQKESFALYALYSKNKPQSDSLLINHGQAFFKQKQLKLGDKMDLWSYLLKPVQRISKYSLLLQDMMRECSPGQSRELAEVKAALEVIHFQLRHGNNLLAMDAIHQCDVNLKEQGQLVRQDEFMVTLRKKKCFRHIFLFQELILFSKTRKTDIGNDTYVYKQSFKTSDIGMTQNSGDSGLCFEIWYRKRKTQDTYTLQAASREVKDAWTKDLGHILWEQAVHNREVRMQERVFMGIGNKPFMDIQPSDAAINDRAINYVLMGRENKLLCSVGSCESKDGLPAARPMSTGSGSTSSSSSSSGRGSLSPVGYLCGPKQVVGARGLEGFVVSPSGVLEEDDVDHESGSQNLLLDSSESSGESVSGFSSSGHSCHSAREKEVEDTSSVCTSTITTREAAAAHHSEDPSAFHKPNASARPPEKPPIPPKPKPKPKNTCVGKSTEV